MADRLYEYEGPVKNQFGEIINQKYTSQTMAPSVKKALSNIGFHYRKDFDRPMNFKVVLDEKFLFDMMPEKTPSNVNKEAIRQLKDNMANDQALDCALYIKKYCGERDCSRCSLAMSDNKYSFHFCGVVSGSTRPSEWPIEGVGK